MDLQAVPATRRGTPRPDRDGRFHNPDGFDISWGPSYGPEPPARAGRQPMRGFEDTYVDIVDYIVRVTHRIWDDQDVGYIYDTYAPGCRVYTESGMLTGVEVIVETTMQTIDALPGGPRFFADEVIWAGDEDTGFATSHRAFYQGRSAGRSEWDEAPGQPVSFWVLANCVSRDNEIFEEWVLYNTGARLQQLGVDLVAAAREYGNERSERGVEGHALTEVERLVGGRKPVPHPPSKRDGFDVDHLVRALLHDTYNRRDLSAIDRAYLPGVRWHGPTNREGYGRAAVRAMARGLMATFPDLGLHVDEVYWQGNDDDGYAVSVRWTAVGTHRGHGLYGPPSGRRVHLWGLQQLYVRDGAITEDWMLFNEFDVLAQIHADHPRS